MPQISSSVVLLLLCSIVSLSLALNPTIDKKYFFVRDDNHLSHDLFQTRNGIIAHSIESTNDTYASKYSFLDIASKEVTPILASLVTACEVAPVPTFQHLHYHAPTDSLVYFCPQNATLLIIDQSSYTVQNSIPFGIQGGSYLLARLSTDGQNVAILGLGTLFTAAPQDSMLVKVDMQTQKISTQILLNQGFNFLSGEAAVAFASSKTAAYIATNKILNSNLITIIYSIVTTGNTYQLKSIYSFTSPNTKKVITYLFCFENSLSLNNGQTLYFISPTGSVTQDALLQLRSITGGQNSLNHPYMTSQYEASSLYAFSTDLSAWKYSVVNGSVTRKNLGSYADIQVASGSQTSGDLMLTLDTLKVNFSILNLQTLQTIYTAISGYENLILTNTTYAVVKSKSNSNFNVYIFDLKTDALIKSVAVGNYFYNKDQHTISYLNTAVSSLGCWLEHVDLITGKVWITLKFTRNAICASWVSNLRFSQNGNPEVVLPFNDHYLIITEAYGQISFPTSVNFDSLNMNFDTLSFYYLTANPETSQVTTSLYFYNPESKKFETNGSIVLDNVPVQNKGFFTVNTEMTVALSNNSFTLIDKLDSPISYSFPSDWNMATSFQDGNGNQYVLGSYANSSFPKGSLPELFATSGDFVSLPGLRLTTVRAQAAGPQSYWLHDDVSSAFGLIRFYNANSLNAKKAFLSIF